ncbi:DNA primase [Mycoplasmopsis equigenitalium]|uniref:DNA primase n=1 Tax=Mycoplasmopsis equigenitalium TaxID=114883 RepID=A0ABY5J1T1_9BACT|nr:DNA primase [Mycoplasmopsis equigenitalium]UUD37174.1 DNA primase [Mycoplasmopsis equigenitalium]
MKYSNQLIQEIKDKNNIVEVVSENISLSKSGSNYLGICPFHDDSKPSLSINEAKQIFKCFACNTGGNVIKFVELYDKISFVAALKKLAQRANITADFSQIDDNIEVDNYSREQYELINSLIDATRFFRFKLHNNEQAKAYLYSRHIDDQIINYFKIGYADGNDVIKELKEKLKYEDYLLEAASLMNEKGNAILWNRIFFPIKDEFGYIVGYSARSLEEGQTKYINSKESAVFQKNRILFNYERAHIIGIEEKEMYLTEGFMDVIALHRAGIKNAVALMGTALTENHFRLLKHIPKIVLFLDGDEAGRKATFKSVDFLVKNNFKVEIVNNTTNLDPDELLNQIGQEKFIELTQNRSTAIDWLYKYLLDYHKISKDNIVSYAITDFVKQFGNYLKFEPKEIFNFYVALIENEYKISRNLFTKPKEVVYPTYIDIEPFRAKIIKKTNIKIQKILMLFLKLNPKFMNLLAKTIDDNTLSYPFSGEYLEDYMKLYDNIKANITLNNQSDGITSERIEARNQLEEIEETYGAKKDIQNIFSIFWKAIDGDTDNNLHKEFWQLYSRALLESITDQIEIAYENSIKSGATAQLKQNIHKKINDLKAKQEQANRYIKIFSE